MNELTNRFGQWYEVYEHDRFYVTLWANQFRYVQGCTWTFRHYGSILGMRP